MYKSDIRDRKRRGDKGDDRELVLPDGGQRYALVRAALGNGRMTLLCEDGQERTGHIRGSMRHSRKKVPIRNGDLVLVALRDYQPDKMDIVHKYTHKECAKMQMLKMLPARLHRALSVADHQALDDDADEEYVVFGDDGDVALDRI